MAKAKIKKPADVTFSGTSIAESAVGGSVVAMLGATDAKGKGVAATYTLGGDDAGLFQIVGNQIVLKSGVTLDHETAANLDLTVTATNKKGAFTEAVVISVTDVNEAPTDVAMLGGSVSEAAVPGAVAAVLVTTDPDTSNTHTYEIVGGTGVSKFAISGNTIVVAPGADLDYETATSYTLAVKTTDQSGASYTETVTVNVTDVADTGLTYVLTVGTDNLVGTIGDDTFIGRQGFDYDNQLPTSEGGDSIDGGDGRDVLKLSLQEEDDDPGILPTTRNVEVLEVTAYYGDRWQLSNQQDLEEIRYVNTNSETASRHIYFDSINNLVDVTLSNVNQDLNLSFFTGAAAGDDDAMTITLDRATEFAGQSAEVDIDVVGDEVVETLNLVSSGPVDNVIDIEGDARAEVVNISGAANLEIDSMTAFASTVQTVNVSGSLDLDMTSTVLTAIEAFNAGTATGDIGAVIGGSNDVVATTGSGDDVVDVQSNTTGVLTVSLGAGDDVVLVDEVNPDSTISGGDGNDQFWVYDTDALDENVLDGVSGFEELWLRSDADSTFDLAAASGFSELHISDLDDNEWSITLNNVSAALANEIYVYETDANNNGNTLHSLDVNLADTSGLSDAATIHLISQSGVDNNEFVIEDLTIDGVENITIATSGDTVVDLDYIYANDLRVLTITGDASLDINHDINADDLRVVDASAFTGDYLDINDIDTDDDLDILGAAESDIRVDAQLGDDARVVTYAGDDSIVLFNDSNSNTADAYVNTGAGDDDINVYGFGGDVEIIAGDGDDDVNAWDDAAFTIDLGAGDDTLDIEVNDGGESYTITLGAGEDQLRVYDADVGSSRDTQFLVTDFNVSEDLIGFEASGSGEEFVQLTSQVNSFDFTGVDAGAETGILELAWEADHNGLDLAALWEANGTLTDDQILSAAGATSSFEILVDAGDEGFLVTYAGGYAFIASYNDDGDGTIQAADNELALIGVLQNVEVGALSASNLYII